MYKLSDKELENFVLDPDYIKEGKGVTATRRIFRNTNYDVFEQTKLSQFKDHLDQGMVDYMHDAQGDDLLLRFLYANSFDEEAAKQQFVNHLYWLDKWLSQESHVDSSRYDKIITIGERDFMHRPVLKINLEHLSKSDNPNTFLSALIKKMIDIEEEMFVPGLIEQKIVVIYPSKIDVSVDVIKDFIDITTTNFPCSMDYLYVIEPNPNCQYLLDHLIDQEKLNPTIQRKIRFVTKQQFIEQFSGNKPQELVQTTKLQRQPTKSMTMLLPGQLQPQAFQIQKLENEQKSMKSEPKDDPPDPELHNCIACTKREKQVPNPPQKQQQDQYIDYYDYNKPQGVYPLLVYAYGYPVKVENAETLMRQDQIVTPQIFDASHLSRLEYSPQRQDMRTTNDQIYPKDQLHETQVQKVNLEHSQTRLGRNKYDDIIEQYNWDKYGGMPYYPTKFDLHREELNLVDQVPIKTNQSQPPQSQLPAQNNGSQYNFPPQNQNQTQTHFNYSNMPSQEFNYPKQQFQEPSIRSLQENRSNLGLNVNIKSNNNINFEPMEYVIPTNQSYLQKDPSPISNQAFNYQPTYHQQQPSISYTQPIKIQKLATFDTSNNQQSNQYTSVQTPKLPSVNQTQLYNYEPPSYNTRFNFGTLPQRPPDPSPVPIQYNYEVHPFQESEKIPTVPADQSAVIKHQDETVIVQDNNTPTTQQLHNNKNCIIF